MTRTSRNGSYSFLLLSQLNLVMRINPLTCDSYNANCGDLGHHQRAVIILLVFASVMGIANFAVNPVFSQIYPTATSLPMTTVSNTTTGFSRTVTFVRTYNTTGFTTSSSYFTQIMVAFVTSTTFFTYVQVTFTSSTSTVAYPAPPNHPNPNSGGPLQVNYFPAIASNAIAYLPLLAIFMLVYGIVNDAKRGIRKI